MHNRRLLISILGLLLIGLSVAVYYYVHNTQTLYPNFSTSEDYLAKVGPLEAQKEAWQATLTGHPVVKNGHVYEHEVGAYLFNTYGIDGIKYCKIYFDHGCENGYMLEMTSLASIESALAVCSKLDAELLGGCIHGAGHQALALLTNYDVPKALALCDTFANTYATSSLHTNMLASCTFGVFMENAEPGMMLGMQNYALMGGMGNVAMSDGMINMAGNPHNLPSAHAVWAPKTADPLFPCDSKLINATALPGCWRMQSVVWSSTWPIAKSVETCDALPSADEKTFCFVGVGDAYVSRGTMTAKDLVGACTHAQTSEWQSRCIIGFVKRAYYTGFTDKLPNQLCAAVNPDWKDKCSAMQAYMQQALQ